MNEKYIRKLATDLSLHLGIADARGLRRDYPEGFNTNIKYMAKRLMKAGWLHRDQLIEAFSTMEDLKEDIK